MSDVDVGSESIEFLVNLTRGINENSRQVVLPALRIGSTRNEITGTTVTLHLHWRKQNQRVMNAQPSTSISGLSTSDNLVEEEKKAGGAPHPEEARLRRLEGPGAFAGLMVRDARAALLTMRKGINSWSCPPRLPS